MTRRASFRCGILWAAAGLLGGCRHEPSQVLVPGGDASRGKAAIASYGCGACHEIPGLAQARGVVGPPLLHFARRVYIAGEVSNTVPSLVQWIRAPQSIEPGTAMPDLGVSEQEARDIAAYLYTLR